ncbi:DUF3021 family protein [Kineothrix alysoides]|uniref:DUF3021 family protein n=1 Tax=Kineothrix alysoides TaxID=1469948 RepID=A0A4R1QXJ3_9FIRM|nr:DUF3021 family protein [Kineothrix alysoides]TCL56554.1 DUF3021 family protein [Kineothrix alysoides]
MKYKNVISDLAASFFISTTLITLGSAIIGSLYLKEVTFGYYAFFSPPLIGLLSSLLGFVGYSKREFSVSEAIARKGIHLFLIEAMIFGLNYASGVRFSPGFSIILALFIVFVFVSVNVIIWLNDKRVADAFNKELEFFQKGMN